MFKFQDVIVGTESHKRLMKQLGKLTQQGKAVDYMEYVTNSGKQGVVKLGRFQPSEVVNHKGREVKCRGEAKTC